MDIVITYTEFLSIRDFLKLAQEDLRKRNFNGAAQDVRLALEILDRAELPTFEPTRRPANV
jgi:hypothetical protein